MEEYQFGHSIMTKISIETKMTFSNNSKEKLKLKIWVTRTLTAT
jgi:hypothetical protein